MGKLCYGSFAGLLKEAMSATNEFLTERLFHPFVHGYKFPHETDQSRYINCKKEIPKYVSERADRPEISEGMEDYFRKNVVGVIKTERRLQLIVLLVALIHGDKSIPKAKKEDLISQADEEHLAGFLSAVYLYAVQQPNRVEEEPLPPPSQDSAYTFINGRFFQDGKEIKLPDKLSPPKDPDASEMPYVAELLKAYAEAAELPSVSVDTIPPEYQLHFIRQRQYFYSVEAVRRRVRDVGVDDQFEMFKQDTYDSIIDVHEQPYRNGYERLLKVLQQAANRPMGRSILERLPNWIGPGEKKGACHILVNEGKITWVIPNVYDLQYPV